MNMGGMTGMNRGGMKNMGGMVNSGGFARMGGMTGMGGMVATGGISGGGGSNSSDAAISSCHAPGQLQVVNSGASAYVIDGVSNPDLTLCRGSTYVFVVKATGHPFYIKTAQGTGTSNAYNDGVTGNGTASGDVTFAVPQSSPATLFYICSLHAPMTGKIHIVD
jgi:hypothetical protein